MSRHFLDLEGARTIPTEHLLLTRRAVLDLTEARAMGAVHGDAGLGKTFAVEEAVGGVDVPVCWTSFPSRPTMRLVAVELVEALTEAPAGERHRFHLTGKLVELLGERDRLIVVDEAQRLNRECIEYLRHLHDHPVTRFGLLLVGGDGCWQVLSREPMLRSRMYRRVVFKALTGPDLLAGIRGYHPMYEAVPDDLVLFIDDYFGHGNLRNWASFTHSAAALCRRLQRTAVDEDLARNVFALHSGGSMLPERAVNVVADSCDSVELARTVAALSDRTAGRVVFHPTPGTTSATEFAADVLTSLGKRFDALRFERVTKRAWELVETWFEAEQVRHLFVLRSERVDPALLRRLTDLACRQGAEVWHIGATTGPGHLGRRWSTPAVLRHWARALDGDSPAAEETEFPEVPDDDFLTFRWSCRRLLDPASFQWVDRTYCESMDTTREWLRSRTRPQRGRADDPGLPDVDEVASQLHAMLVSATSQADALTRLRGAQAAYFLAGLLIEYPASDGESGSVPLGPSLDPTMARRLRRLCVPVSAAAMALVLATDLRAEGLSRLSLCDVDGDGGGVRIGDGGHRFAVPAYAQSLLRALLIERRIGGAAGIDALFVDPRTSSRITPDRMGTLLRKLSWSTACSVGLLAPEPVPALPSRWLTERRMKVWLLQAEDAAVG